jgi:hypothetical protein
MLMAVELPLPVLDIDTPEETAFCTCESHVGTRKLPLSAFRAHPGKENGVQSWCVECERRAARRRWQHRRMIELRSRWVTLGLINGSKD